MKKTTFVALLLLCSTCLANGFDNSINAIEQSWARVYYDTPKSKQARAYQVLLDQVGDLAQKHPEQPAFIYWQAVVLSTQAEHLDPLSALSAIEKARTLLEKAIAIDPKVMNGSAFVTLGALYYKTPGWPIAFGDTEKAKVFLETALKINPNGVDSNYFYGDFLLNINRPKEAENFFARALAPTKAVLTYTDSRLQQEAKAGLKKAKDQAG